MLSGAISIASSKGLSRKTPLQNCTPFIITFSLGLELIGIVALIILYDKSDRMDNLLYISTVSYIIISTIYFAWHSVVKENTFELVAFSLMSTILNSIAIYLAFQHDVEDPIKYSCITFFVLCQVIYYSLSVYTYKHFHTYMLGGHDESTFERKLVAVRTFETFMSMIKVDFMLYVLQSAYFLFYVIVHWKEFFIPGVIIGIFGFGLLVSHSFLGIYAISREKVNRVIVYFVLMVFTLGVKVFFVIVLSLQPGESMKNLLVNQCYVVFIGNFLVYIAILYLGYWTHKSFGIGAMSIIRKTNDDAIKAPFI